ncbi:hypothetical protein DY000_02015006 [Brassica cretica]|uniref:Uncharacterized protein n=1 Tax=Brassica cretica TaxID=69181 RepID=A0ABQ7CTQ8_BRACR|nr:hypothetical protein DY000_02015006 [Brassica cretica]
MVCERRFEVWQQVFIRRRGETCDTGKSRNVKRGGELMWVDMLLIDVNSTIMQATVYANRLPRFPSKLAAGKMFSISGFDVARCAQNYRLTDSPLLGLLEVRCCCEEQCYPVSKYETRQLEIPFSEGGAGASMS